MAIPVVLRANSGALTVDLEAAPASVTGTVAVTEANDTPTASGTITITPPAPSGSSSSGGHHFPEGLRLIDRRQRDDEDVLVALL